MTAENHNQVPDREWLLKMADAEDACRSVSVGGMAADLLGGTSDKNDGRCPAGFRTFYRLCTAGQGLDR